MPTEDCGVCGETVSFADAVHVLVHTRSESGVIDRYVCPRCYDAELADIFE